MQAKKTGNRKKDVFVPILFLYFDKYLYKILIYNVLLYIKITFSRFAQKDSAKHFHQQYVLDLQPIGDKVRKCFQYFNKTLGVL